MSFRAQRGFNIVLRGADEMEHRLIERIPYYAAGRQYDIPSAHQRAALENLLGHCVSFSVCDVHAVHAAHQAFACQRMHRGDRRQRLPCVPVEYLHRVILQHLEDNVAAVRVQRIHPAA